MSGGIGGLIGGGLSLASGIGSFGRKGVSRGDVLENSPLGVNAFAPVGSVSNEIRLGDQTISRFTPNPGAISNQLFQQFPQLFQGLQDERGRLTPAFNALKEAALKQIGNARDRGTSNLRDRLAQRRVRGSFSENALVRAEREFGESAAEASATTELARIEGQQSIIAQQQGLILGAAQKELDELRIALGSGQQANASFTGSQANATNAASLNNDVRRGAISDITGGATLLANTAESFFARPPSVANIPFGPQTLARGEFRF